MFHRPRAGFDKGSLEWLEQLFRQTVGDEKEIRREDFQKIVISKNVSENHHKHFLHNSPFPALFHRTSLPNIRQRQLRLHLTARILGCHAPIRWAISGGQNQIFVQSLRPRWYCRNNLFFG